MTGEIKKLILGFLVHFSFGQTVKTVTNGKQNIARRAEDIMLKRSPRKTRN